MFIGNILKKCSSCQKPVKSLNKLKVCNDCSSVEKRNIGKDLSDKSCKICSAKADKFFRTKSGICSICSVKYGRFSKNRKCGDCKSEETTKWFIGGKGFQCQSCNNRHKKFIHIYDLNKKRLDEPCLDCGLIVPRKDFFLQFSKCIKCFDIKPVKKRPRRNCSKCKRLRYVFWRSGYGHCCSKCRRVIDGKYDDDNLKKNLKAKTDLVVRYKNSVNYARAKNYRFDFSESGYTGLLKRPCYYCNGDLPESGVGLDRIDNNLGYIKENVVRACGPCNKIRNIYLSVKEMKIAMTAVIEYRKEALK